MFNFRKDKEDSPLDDAVERIWIELNLEPTDSEEYERLLSTLERLEKIRPDDKSKPVSKDVWVQAGVSILGILVIVVFEQSGHTITTKALSQLPKLK